MVQSSEAWTDRFREPSISDLRRGLEADATDAFDRMRRLLTRRREIRETPAWYGSCWRWVLEYRVPLRSTPIAVLVPSPDDLQLLMPLDADFLATLPTRRMKRSIRDGLELADAPFDTNLAVWSIDPPSLVEDLQDLVRRRLEFVHDAG